MAIVVTSDMPYGDHLPGPSGGQLGAEPGGVGDDHPDRPHTASRRILDIVRCA